MTLSVVHHVRFLMVICHSSKPIEIVQYIKMYTCVLQHHIHMYWDYLKLITGVELKHSVPAVQYMERIVRAGGCLEVIAQWSECWQLKPEALGSNPGSCGLFTSPLPWHKQPVYFLAEARWPRTLLCSCLHTFCSKREMLSRRIYSGMLSRKIWSGFRGN